MISGLVFNIQKYSVQDGPGIRTTVFLKGCPLCCAWCHNPESISPRRELIVVESRCAGCGECRLACPFADQIGGEGLWPARQADCVQCAACVEACPTGARQMVGRAMTVAEVMAEILKDRIFYEESSGGVTFSGGEPLMQPKFLRSLLESCREHGIHTAVDTCGFGSTDHLLEIAPLTGLFLFDLKFMDETKHKEYCGVSNQPILENLRALSCLHQNIWIRVPVIPGVNDSESNLHDMARFVSTLAGVRQVNLLPYHKTGILKHERVGRDFQLKEVPSPTASQMEDAQRHFQALGLGGIMASTLLKVSKPTGLVHS